jgi:hypothetical protein
MPIQLSVSLKIGLACENEFHYQSSQAKQKTAEGGPK